MAGQSLKNIDMPRKFAIENSAVSPISLQFQIFELKMTTGVVRTRKFMTPYSIQANGSRCAPSRIVIRQQEGDSADNEIFISSSRTVQGQVAIPLVHLDLDHQSIGFVFIERVSISIRCIKLRSIE